ncbi:DUF2889 domain-containing protein [Pseudofrankia inefficax]|uniref:DUF2889 domain-containing protein n=1 Tax=Pseudofrankia inefficax (strain DSM 45817 / CECT 9037 / DDB 130130 / EuI1c) TaxID=298654 RepID=E3IY81_PSEI1|nr:DUF2889 domain-containing protein [Pseudofrankia inefficax]ADP82679.1 Protein of unknown function DUF2889 [Pseudofrankia inefficax]
MTVQTRQEATAGPDRPLWPGTEGPTSRSPARVPGSVRRTTSIDMLRPDGPDGALHLVGRGHDLLTGPDGGARVLDAAGLFVALDYTGARLIHELRTDPAPPGLADLVGRSALSKFRPAARAALGDGHLGSVLAQLLDDVPVATIVSAAALARLGVHRDASSGVQRTARTDICAGWQADGALARRRAAGAEKGPMRDRGPLAGDLVSADGLGWHPMPPLEPAAMRRVRRLDLVPVAAASPAARAAVPAGAAFLADGLVRDSFHDPRDAEVVVHEFTVRAAVAADGTVLDASAGIGVVPGPQCPQARPSAARIVGRRAGELRDGVAREFVGITTCTHLNDTLRTLGDLPRLVAALTA